MASFAVLQQRTRAWLWSLVFGLRDAAAARLVLGLWDVGRALVLRSRGELFEALDAPQLNGCGGDTTVFTMEFTPTADLQCYQLLVRDEGFDTTLTSIPIRVPEPASVLSVSLGAFGLLGAARRRRAA